MPEPDLVTDLESVLERLRAKQPREPKNLTEAGAKAREFLRASRQQASEKDEDDDARDEPARTQSGTAAVTASGKE